MGVVCYCSIIRLTLTGTEKKITPFAGHLLCFKPNARSVLFNLHGGNAERQIRIVQVDKKVRNQSSRSSRCGEQQEIQDDSGDGVDGPGD